MGKNNATLTDPRMLIEAGINPKTGLPVKLGEDACTLKTDIKKTLRILDEQTAVNRYTWHELPRGLTGRLMERILYYRGQAMLFMLKNKFYFLPYALDGTIDVYGRFEGVTPLPFNGTSSDGKNNDKPWIQGLKFEPVYEVILPEEYEGMPEEEILRKLEKSCVLFKDYTEQISQTNIARQILQDPVLDIMAECFPFMRTALLNGTGVQGMRVNTETESANVFAANNQIKKAALEGRSKIPIVGNVDFQDLSTGTVSKAEEYLLAMQSLDNYRLSLYGLDNGGLFQKKSHMLEAEQEMNTGNVGLIADDGLRYRQEAATIANSIWGTSIWVEPNEVTIGMDMNGDGYAGGEEQKEVADDGTV